MLHKLKIKQTYLNRILRKEKTFEVRENDRDYQKGDIIQFLPLEQDDSEESCYEIQKPLPEYEITYIHQGLGMLDNYVCLSITEKVKD